MSNNRRVSGGDKFWATMFILFAIFLVVTVTPTSPPFIITVLMWLGAASMVYLAIDNIT